MKRKINLKQIFPIIILLLFIASAVGLYTNKVFYFSSLHDEIQLVVKGTKPEKVSDVVNSFSKDANVSRIDRKNNIIVFEHTSVDAVKKEASDAVNGDATVDTYVSEEIQSTSQTDALNSVLFSLIIMTVVSFISIFYFILRFNNTTKWKDYLRILIAFIFSIIVGSFLMLGTLSVASRYYQVKSIDLSTFYISALFIFGIWFLALWKYKTGDEEVSLVSSLEGFVENRFPHTLKIAFIVLVIVSFSLGVNFVMFAAFAFAAIIYAFISSYFTAWILNRDISGLSGLRSKIQRPTFRRNKAMKEDGTVEEKNSIDKSDKKKKKKKTKHKKK